MRLHFKLLLLVLIALCHGATDVRAQNATLNLSSVFGAPGATVSLPVVLGGAARPAGLQWTMGYSTTDLLFTGAEPGPAATAAGKDIQCQSGANKTTCLVVGFNQETISSGVVAIVTFTIVSTTHAGSASITLSGLSATTAQGGGIPLAGCGNKVTILQNGGPPPPRITGVLDAAAFEPVIAPGAIISVFGDFDVTTTTAGTVPLPGRLNGYSVTFDGVPGSLFGVFGDDACLGFSQANVQVPWNLVPGAEAVEVRIHQEGENGEVWSDPFEVDIEAASPGAFEFPIGSGQAIVTNFKLSPEDDVIAGSFAQPAGAVDPVVGQPVAVGGVATIWLNGLGPTSPAVPTGESPGAGAPLSETDKAVRVLIGGVEAQIIGRPVLHPTLVALNQINVVVSPGTPVGDKVPIVIEVDCGDGTVLRSKQGVTIAVRPAP